MEGVGLSYKLKKNKREWPRKLLGFCILLNTFCDPAWSWKAVNIAGSDIPNDLGALLPPDFCCSGPPPRRPLPSPCSHVAIYFLHFFACRDSQKISCENLLTKTLQTILPFKIQNLAKKISCEIRRQIDRGELYNVM